MTVAASSPFEHAGSHGLVARVTTLARSIRLFFAKQAQLAEFRRLDQHMLDDIGVVRADIHGVVEVMFRDRYAS